MSDDVFYCIVENTDDNSERVDYSVTDPEDLEDFYISFPTLELARAYINTIGGFTVGVYSTIGQCSPRLIQELS